MPVEDPCNGVHLPRMKRREMDALGAGKCRRFPDSSQDFEWCALFALALMTGMIPNEYLEMKWSNIDWQRGAASVYRTIHVSRGEPGDRPQLLHSAAFVWVRRCIEPVAYQTCTARIEGAPVFPSMTLTFKTASIFRFEKSFPT